EVEFLLDSGANEHMLCSRANLKTLSSRKSKIFTATGSGENTLGYFGEPKPLIFNSGAQVPLKSAVFCEKLTDNLLSVSKLTEEGFTVIFQKGSFTIFQGKVNFKGRVVHQQV